MKVALVHDFLVKKGGAESVLSCFLEIFPEAQIFTLFYDEELMKDLFPPCKVITSPLNKWLKFSKSVYKYFFYSYPRQIENFNFSGFDLVISLSNSYAHGVLTDSGTKHVAYYHSPMRYAWDWKNEYLAENSFHGIKKAIFSYLMKGIREWDQVASSRPELVLANSNFVRKRIKKYYRREATVVYPPVDTQRFKLSSSHDDYFLIVSTLSPYKKIDLAIKLFNKIGRKLRIIGSGSQEKYLKNIANSNIEFLGFQNNESVVKQMQGCKAFVFCGEEDFGIAPVEAMACGKPVFAYGKGGLLETVIPGFSGELYSQQNLVEMEAALGRLIYNYEFYDPILICQQAEKFSKQKFIDNIKRLLKLLK